MKNKKISFIVMSALAFFVVVLISYMMIESNKVKLIQDIFTFEYGEVITLDPIDVLATKDEDILDNAIITYEIENEENKDYSKLGEYKAVIEYKNNSEDVKFEFTIIIEDTTRPKISVLDDKKIIEIPIGFEDDISSLFIIEDFSDLNVDINVDNLDINTVGEYEIEVTAIDTYDNKVSEKFVVKVRQELISDLSEVEFRKHIFVALGGTLNNENIVNVQSTQLNYIEYDFSNELNKVFGKKVMFALIDGSVNGKAMNTEFEIDLEGNLTSRFYENPSEKFEHEMVNIFNKEIKELVSLLEDDQVYMKYMLTGDDLYRGLSKNLETEMEKSEFRVDMSNIDKNQIFTLINEDSTEDEVTLDIKYSINYHVMPFIATSNELYDNIFDHSDPYNYRIKKITMEDDFLGFYDFINEKENKYKEDRDTLQNNWVELVSGFE